MNWIVAKKDLELALDLILRVPPRGGITSSEFIRFAKKKNEAILALSSDMSAVAMLSSKYPFEHSLYVDRRLFEPFVSGGKDLKSQEYTFSLAENGTVTVKHGSRTAVFAKTKQASGYHDPPKYNTKEHLHLDEKWLKIMSCAISCATIDPVAAKFNCVYTVPTKEGISFYSSNNTVTFFGTIKTTSKPTSAVAFPLLLAANVDCAELQHMYWDAKSAMLSSQRGRMWQAVKIEARKSFPKKAIDELLKNGLKNEALFTIDSEKVSEAAARLSNCLTAVSREDLVLKFQVKANEKKVKLFAGTGATEFSEYVPLIKLSKIDFLVEWPLAEVLPVLIFSKNQGDAKVITTKSGVTFYKTSNITLIVATKVGKK